MTSAPLTRVPRTFADVDGPARMSIPSGYTTVRVPLEGGVVVVVAPGTVVVVVVVVVTVTVVDGAGGVDVVVATGGRTDLAEDPHPAARAAATIPMAPSLTLDSL